MTKEDQILQILEDMKNRMSKMESDVADMKSQMVTKKDLQEAFSGVGEMFEKVYGEVVTLKDTVFDNKQVLMQNSYDINKLRMAK